MHGLSCGVVYYDSVTAACAVNDSMHGATPSLSVREGPRFGPLMENIVGEGTSVIPSKWMLYHLNSVVYMIYTSTMYINMYMYMYILYMYILYMYVYLCMCTVHVHVCTCTQVFMYTHMY